MSSKVGLFSLGARSFALPVTEIRYIVSAPQLFVLPLQPAQFCGVFLCRGEIVPLLNLWEYFDIRPCDYRYTIVMGTEAGGVGLPADQVCKIVERDQGILENNAGDGPGRVFIWSKTSYPLLDNDELLAGVLPPEKTQRCSPGQKGSKEA